MSKFLYISVDLLSLFFPLTFSFHKKANFSEKWIYLFPALLISATLFILWDIIFTRIGVWGFNQKYITGLYFYNLPIEEVLFFFCIPYSCIFVYEAIKHFKKGYVLDAYANKISGVLVIFLLVVGFTNFEKTYTFVTFLGCSLLIALSQWKWKLHFMGRFYFAFLFILIPFFVVNGILTGSITSEPVVWYNEKQFSGIRIGTIPFEDAFYGLFLILVNISLFEGLQIKLQRR